MSSELSLTSALACGKEALGRRRAVLMMEVRPGRSLLHVNSVL